MSVARRQSIEILTPEGVRFRLPLASPLIRMLAVIIDLAIVVTLYSVLGILAVVSEWISADLAGAIGIVLYFVLSLFYAMFLEWAWRGQTMGKKILRLRVMDERGLKLRASQIVVRNLLRVADQLPAFYFLGGVVALLNSKAQRLGDYAAGTIVIRLPKTEAPDIERLNPGRFNSFKDYPALEARLRQAIGPEESELIVSALLRAEELDPEKRIELFKEIADDLQTKANFPEEITDVIGPEQYVRNTADTVFRNQ